MKLRTRPALAALLAWTAATAVAPSSAQTPAASAPVAASAPAARPLTSLPYTPGIDLTAMDTTADPCTDFYQYACGGWMKGNPIPGDEKSWSVYGKMARDNQQFLWGILDGLSRGGATRSAQQVKLGDLYGACMDEDAIEKRGAEPLKAMLAPVEEMKSRADLPGVLASLHQATGDTMLFGFAASQDYADSSQVIAFANAGGLGLPDRDYYVQKDKHMAALRRQYVAHLERTFALLGDSTAQAKREASTVMAIETALARATYTSVQRRSPHNLFHKLDLRALQKLTPAFDWHAYLVAMGLPDTRTVNVSEPNYYRAMQTVLATRPLADVKVYLRWHTANSVSGYLSKPFIAEQFEFFGRTLYGTPELPVRWKRCVQDVDAQMGEALGQEFVARAFTPALKDKAVHMTRQIEEAMAHEIEVLDWMSPLTKARAMDKLHAIVNKFGYPDVWRDYAALEVKGDDFFGNSVRATVFESKRQVAKIGKPVDRGEWSMTMTPPTVNAEYNAATNDITFPAGVLQPPLFDPKMDDAPNYGNTGGTIGHELTHGFDDEGRQYDAQGNLRNWWTRKDEREFEKRTQCVVDQYAKYVVVDDIHINSRLTLGEDLADLGGLVLALAAWRAEIAEHPAQSRDGFDPMQRFFIGNAQWACENSRPEDLRANAVNEPHSPSKYRVNGLFANFPEFEQAFHCKSGQPMAPVKRCRVW